MSPVGKAASSKRGRPKGPLRDLAARCDTQERATATASQWANLERTRASSADQWPDWCLLPSALVAEWAKRSFGWHAGVVSAVPALTAIGAWRWGRHILAVDPDLWAALAATPLGDVPAETVLSLPAWGLYIAAPADTGIHGAYVTIDVARTDPLLLVVVDMPGERTAAVPVALDRPLDRAVAEAARHAQTVEELRAIPSSPDGETAEDYLIEPVTIAELVATVTPIVATVLYVCSTEPDLIDPTGRARTLRRPPHPSANHPIVWEAGWRIGSQLRAAHVTRDRLGGTNSSPRAHLRAAHWHHYWTGPRADQRLVLRWVHPTLVGGDINDLPTTVTPT